MATSWTLQIVAAFCVVLACRSVRVDSDDGDADDYEAKSATSTTTTDPTPKYLKKFIEAADADVVKVVPEGFKALTVSPFKCTNENREPCLAGEPVDALCRRNTTCDKPWKEKHKGPWMPCCKKIALMQLLVWFNNAVGPIDVDGNGFWWAINGGTLLGSLRNEDVVDWTTDVDVIIPKAYEKFVQEKLEASIKDADSAYGWTVEDSEGQEDVRRLNFQNENAVMDVFFLHEFQNSDRADAKRVFSSSGDSAFSAAWLLPTPSIPNRTEIEAGNTKPCVKYWEDAFPITWLFPLKYCTIQGKQFPCQQQSEKLLEFNYGAEWKKPDGLKPKGRVHADCEGKKQ